MKPKLLFILLSLVVAACGFSPDHWRQHLMQTSDIEVCAASIDPRGAGWAVRKQAALELIQTKKITCDYNLAIQFLQVEIGQNNAQLAASMSLMQNGTSMIAAGQPKQSTSPPQITTTNCRYIGQTMSCTSF